MSAIKVGITRRSAEVRALGLALLGALAAALVIVAPSPAAAAPAVQTVQLHIVNIECLFQNDTFGSDEPYLLVNGARVWSGSNVDDGDVARVDYQSGFDDVIQIDLWEDDGGLSGRDDHIATWFIFDSEVGTGTHTVQSPWDSGAGLYDLTYEVV